MITKLKYQINKKSRRTFTETKKELYKLKELSESYENKLKALEEKFLMKG